MPSSCVRGTRGRFGGLRPVPGVLSSPCPPSRPACPALCVAGSPVWVSFTLARWYCAFRGLGPVSLSGIPRVSFVCVLPGVLPPPPSPGWCGARTLRGPGAGRWSGRCMRSRHLRASCPGPVLRLACLGGGRPGPASPLPGLACALPVGWVRAPRAFQRRGAGWGWVGGGAGLCTVPPDCGAGGASGAGGCLASVRPSAFPGQATKVVSLVLLWPWRAWLPYRSGSCCLLSPGMVRVWRPCALARGCLLFVVPAGAGGRERGGGPRSGLSLGRHCPAGGRGDHPCCLGGGGARRPRGLRAGGGGGGTAERVPPWPPLALSLGGVPGGSLPCPPFVADVFFSGVRVRFGSRGSLVRRCGLPSAGQPGGEGGAGRGGPWTAPRRLQQTRSVKNRSHSLHDMPNYFSDAVNTLSLSQSNTLEFKTNTQHCCTSRFHRRRHHETLWDAVISGFFAAMVQCMPCRVE